MLFRHRNCGMAEKLLARVVSQSPWCERRSGARMKILAPHNRNSWDFRLNTCASLGFRLNSFGSMVGSRKWMRLHSNTPSRSVSARIFISEFVQFALGCREKKNIFGKAGITFCETNTNFCCEPVVCRDNFTARQPGGTLAPQVVGKGHGHYLLARNAPVNSLTNFFDFWRRGKAKTKLNRTEQSAEQIRQFALF